jgi:hypothetical protein
VPQPPPSPACGPRASSLPGKPSLPPSRDLPWRPQRAQHSIPNPSAAACKPLAQPPARALPVVQPSAPRLPSPRRAPSSHVARALARNATGPAPSRGRAPPQPHGRASSPLSPRVSLGRAAATSVVVGLAAPHSPLPRPRRVQPWPSRALALRCVPTALGADPPPPSPCAEALAEGPSHLVWLAQRRRPRQQQRR